MRYKLTPPDINGNVSWILRIDNNLIQNIRVEESSREYQSYLEWVAEGNTPEPADE
jgi:hypothetical protein